MAVFLFLVGVNVTKTFQEERLDGIDIYTKRKQALGYCSSPADVKEMRSKSIDVRCSTESGPFIPIG